MGDNKLKPPTDELDALLDDALNAFDTEETIPSSVPPAPAPSPANPQALDSNQTAVASSSKPLKSGLAFDPLGGRGKKKHHLPATSSESTVPKTTTGERGVPADEHESDEYNSEDLEDVSAGLSQLLAELARANLASGTEDAGTASYESTAPENLGGGGAGLAETLRALADNQAAFSGASGADTGNLDTIPNDLLEKLAAQFGGMEGLEGLEGLLPPELLGGRSGGGGGGSGGGGGPRSSSSSGGAPGSTGGEFPGMASLVDTIMHQLLSKDVLYQPMKDIGNKYPEWLAGNKESLDPEQYKQYEEQYEYIQKICTMYETDPGNYTVLMDLLQEMQQRGQPPQEIIDELAPGMTFGPDGLPSMAGVGGLPGGVDPSECCIQ